jgi:hypothetical protein
MTSIRVGIVVLGVAGAVFAAHVRADRSAVGTFSVSDATVTEGNVGPKTARFTVSLSQANPDEQLVRYETGGVGDTATGAAGAFTYNSAGPITIPGIGSIPGPASAYPATVNVSGVPGTVQQVSVRLNNLSHTLVQDLDVLVVGPGGQKVMVMSDVSVGGATGITVTIRDLAGSMPLNAPLTTGTYSPTDFFNGPDVMPAPAPAGPYSFDLSVFNGVNPNGTWSVFIYDDGFDHTGSVASVSILVATSATGGDYGPVFGTLSFPPGTLTQVIDVPINGDLSPEANETFLMAINSSTLTVEDPFGTGTILNDDQIYVGPGDFDGDGKTDAAVTRTGSIIWHILNGTGYTGVGFGDHTQDIRVPGDYDGDGRTDIAIWRPSTGTFWVLRSSDGGVVSQPWGQNGDDPRVVGDYDGDGRDDFAIYRPGNPSVWWVRQSQFGNVVGTAFGQTGDKPAPGDFDGDGKMDPAVARGPGNATFYILQSMNGFTALPWGLFSDSILSGDYDADGLWDVAVARQTSGAWTHYVRQSSNGGLLAGVWGLATDILTPGDYDRDNRTDFAVWRPSPAPSAFYARQSSNGALWATGWGLDGDYPVMFFVVH